MVEIIPAIVVTIAGLLLSPIVAFLDQRRAEQAARRFIEQQARVLAGVISCLITVPISAPKPPEPSGPNVLKAFALIVALLGVITLVANWSYVKDHLGNLVFFAWLFLTMVFGMFVQVIAANRHAGSPLLQIDAAQLLYPLLFSIIVFYPVWGIAASAPRTFLSFYAAFQNGFFWETVVASAKRPSLGIRYERR